MRERPDPSTGCPPAEEILDWLRARLARDRKEAVAAHLELCPRCRTARAWLEDVLSATAGGPLAQPPERVLARAFDIVSPTAPASRFERRPWSPATLVRDSLLDPLAAGVRGPASAAGPGGVLRRLLYRAGDADLDLEVAERAGPSPELGGGGDDDAAEHAGGGARLRLTGQLLVAGPLPPADLLAVLRREGAVTARAAGNAVGVFVFPALEPGRYELEVWLPGKGRAFRVAPLELEAAGG